MEIHRHLSVAWRQLGSKWGEPVDLDNEDSASKIQFEKVPLDLPKSTFSSEEYLLKMKRKRPTPYERTKTDSRKINKTKTHIESSTESMYKSDYSIESYPETGDFKACASIKKEGFVDAMKDLVNDLQNHLDDSFLAGQDVPVEELDSSIKEKRLELEVVFKQLKDFAFNYVRRKSKKKRN